MVIHQKQSIGDAKKDLTKNFPKMFIKKILKDLGPAKYNLAINWDDLKKG